MYRRAAVGTGFEWHVFETPLLTILQEGAIALSGGIGGNVSRCFLSFMRP